MTGESPDPLPTHQHPSEPLALPQRQGVRRFWFELRQFLLLMMGALIAAAGYVLFQVPHNIVGGGVSGIAIIINAYTGFSIGIFFLLVNIPLLIVGFFSLGRWRFLFSTVLVVVLFSATTEIANRYQSIYLGSTEPITGDLLLSTVYAGLVGGIGGGLVYAAGATLGGTAILARMLQKRTGIPMSQVYLWLDGGIVVSAGILFGWEIALYSILTLLLSGLAADYTLEGPSRTRTAIIITTQRDAMVQTLLARFGRGVSHWEAVGGYSGAKRTVIMCTIYRPQVNELKQIIGAVDPKAFVSIGTTQQVLGRGFDRLQS